MFVIDVQCAKSTAVETADITSQHNIPEQVWTRENVLMVQ